MTPSFDPLATSDLIVEGYRRYLRSLLPVRDPGIAAALDQEISQSRLTKGPLLEAAPPYEHGATLMDLVAEGVLNPAFPGLASTAVPLDRPLYRHQEQAIRKITAGRNVIVATGTGSGKTESFLLPILDALSAEHAAGTLAPGVRALLLYPMNALANDQIKRLREALAVAPHITFGRYVGATPRTAREAADKFAVLNPDQPRLPNELLSRAEMRETPPHILLTNYAMLEYLLLRPADLDLFEGAHGGHWSLIAVDEAHVYDGAKAAELAMLLRRLRDRVAGGRSLRCIATSATVGDDPRAVTEFAQRLFDADFAWVPGDESRQDLVGATRRAMPEGPFWGPLDPASYLFIARSADPEEEVLRLAEAAGVAGYTDAATALAHEHRIAELRALLAECPRPFTDLATELFDPGIDRNEALAALVTAGARVRDSSGSAVLSARYHLFTRASEGAYTCLSAAGPHVSLARRETCGSCSAAMFEFGACKRCGAVYLSGSVRHTPEGLVFVPRQRPTEPRTWLLAGDAPTVVDEDDETLEETGRALHTDDGALCVGCGGLHVVGTGTCACGEGRLWPVRRLNTKSDTVSGCLSCGARGAAMVRQFETGGDAAASVITTALYQALPPADGEEADQPGEGRKLLLFSDSRQAAAFFAPYLATSYETIQHRRLILDALSSATADDETAHVDDVAYHLVRMANQAHVFQRRMSRQERQRETSLWLMAELVATDDRQSLEGRGLLRVELDREPTWRLPPGLGALGLSEQESWDLLGELMRSLRQQGAITMPDDVDPHDEHFDPRRGPIYVRAESSEPKRKVLSWLPTRGMNRRLDYVARVLKAVGSPADPREVLHGCWRFLEGQRDGWLAMPPAGRLGVVRQVDHTWLRLAPVGPDDVMYRCRQCRRLASVSVRDVCVTIGCGGMLEKYVVPAAGEDDDHYRHLYRSLNPVPLSASEHTGQLTSAEAADIQQRFIRGEVNALSCSTTFELGVDVGELQSVVLRNMPPTTANYVQRAGRAGRRTDAAALIVTYAQRRSHDLAQYQNPVTMVAGEVRAPYVPLGNERIDRRHAHSVALAAFFRHYKELTGEEWHDAGEFFLPGPGGTPPPSQRVPGFLDPVPSGVQQSLRRVLPNAVQAEIGLDTGDWVRELAGLLEGIQAELATDVDAFEERRQQAFTARQGRLVERFEKTINTLTKRNLINFLANRNVLPKYGFPTDTVELRTQYSDSRIGGKLDLSRDLSTAIYEFAPGAELVAGGWLWTSGGVYRLPDRELITKYYAVCRACGGYRESDEPLDPICPSCDAPHTGRPRLYCVPEFGFVAQGNAKRPGMSPPRRSWNGMTYVLSLASEVQEATWQLANGGRVTTRAGSRGQLIAVSEGPGLAGYLICDWCGWGTQTAGKVPDKHPHLLRGRDCTGPLQSRSLAHRYETDILAISFDALATPLVDNVHWRSTLYALLEGVSERLQISRDDIDGTLYPTPGGRTSLVIFDAVPGGAGSAIRIARSFDEVVRAALDRVERCDCGEETSCYGCLRGYRNQPFHEQLRRGAAVDFLRPLVPALRTG
jgi:DEAD/DEAH box helicase/Domain of unknown function (DUF1998)/Helicase conserved C-terminal domain